MKKFNLKFFSFCIIIYFSSSNAYSQVEQVKSDTVVLSPKYIIKNEMTAEQLQLVPTTDRGLPDWLPILSENITKIESHSGDKAANLANDKKCRLVVVLYVKESFFKNIPDSLKPYYLK